MRMLGRQASPSAEIKRCSQTLAGNTLRTRMAVNSAFLSVLSRPV